MRLSALISLFLVGSVCSNSLPVVRGRNAEQSRAAVISGGPLAAAGEFPYAGFLMLTNGMIVGGGTLIGPYHVLTSAQSLVYSLSPSFMSMLRVTFNSTSTYGGVGAFLLPDNNLAIVVLSSPVTNLTFATLPVLPTTIPPPTTTTKAPTTKTSLPTTKPPQTTTKIPTTTKSPPTTKPTQTTTKATTTRTTKTTTKTPVPTTKTTAKTSTTTKQGSTVKTTTKVKTKPVVSKKPSSNRAFSSYTNMSAVIVGWGSTKPGVSTAPLLLRKINATILDNQSCTSYYGNNTFFGADMLCASASVPCLDDNGSPILVGGVQVGISMWCTGPAASNYSGTYTRVTTYVDWIATTMANYPGPVVG